MVTARTLLAVFALLLGATHCVDIDDRDLEVTDGNGDDGTGGGSNTSCEVGADDTDCTICAKDYCCNEFTICDESVDCVNFAGCWADCAADDDVCIGNCAEQWPQGGLDFYDFLYCTYQECFDVCS